jgi:hypothetical protein
MTRHLLGLRGSLPGARLWRRELSAIPEGRAGLAKLREIAAPLGQGEHDLGTLQAGYAVG